MFKKNTADMLDEMFEAQRSFEAFMGHNISEMDEKTRGEYVRLHVLMLEDELHEMLHEIPFFKPWKKYSNVPVDNLIAWQMARMEMVDALHFFLTICLGLGFTASELFAMYNSKLDKNYKRQLNTEQYKRDVE